MTYLQLYGVKIKNVRSFLSFRDKTINKSNPMKFEADLSDWIYLTGNFVPAYYYYKGFGPRPYNLLSFNCKHATLYGIRNSYEYMNYEHGIKTISKAIDKVRPNAAFDYIAKNL